MHLRPLPEQQVSEEVATLFEKIKERFHIPSVPLLFEYLANTPSYFFILWKYMEQNMEDASFKSYQSQLVTFSQEAVEKIYTPSSAMLSFSQRLSKEEKEEIQKTISTLKTLNSALFLFTVGIRENIKGVAMRFEVLEEHKKKATALHTFIENDYSTDQKIAAAQRLLVPLFGSRALSLPKYPDFFTYTSWEMEALAKKEVYLKTRVGLEQIALLMLGRFTHPLRLSYGQIVELLKEHPYGFELLQLLLDTFPSQFPHLLLTANVMEQVLVNSDERSLVQRKK